MMTGKYQPELSYFAGIYDIVVPQDHPLREFLRICHNFDFVYEELKEKYCQDNGAGAIDPTLLFKYLILKAMYRLSDVDVVERSRYDMSFKFFLDLNPEDDVIHPSTLSKFRTLRLKDEKFLDLLMNKSVAVAMQEGVLDKDVDVIIDSMHISARHNQRTPEMVLSELARNLRKAVYESDKKAASSWKNRFPENADKKGLGELINYCHELIDLIKDEDAFKYKAHVKESLHLLEEVVAEAEQPETEEHVYLAPLDPDASLGHKSAYNAFYGYKDHYLLTLNRIIVSALFTAGHINDGGQLIPLVEKARAAGLHIKSVIGDMAYSGKANLEFAESAANPDEAFQLVSKLNPIISASMLDQERDGFTYNKDAKRFTCPRGRMADCVVNYPGRGNHNPRQVHRFNGSGCAGCPLDGKCHKIGAKTRSYSVPIPSDLHQKQQAFQETEKFKELMSYRYEIEAKNSELKHEHGLDRAESTRLIRMSIQGATAMFVANLKRIMTLKREVKG